MRLLRSHGITRDESRMSRKPDGPWYYEQTDLGFNYRMTDIQAALGTSQMQRLDEYVSRRHEIAERYNTEFAGLSIRLPWQDPVGRSSFHLYVIRIDRSKADLSQKDLFIRLKARGISVNLHYIPIPMHPYYSRLGFRSADFPEAEAYYAEAISLPMFPTLTSAQIQTTVDAVRTEIQR
jgi:dTDP-4-amino-4,6-dideoxygalactose transaminase